MADEPGPWDDFAPTKESGPWDDFAPSHQEIPQPFIDRVRAGEAVKNILSKAASGFEGSTPTGLSDETLQQGIDIGLFHDPAKGRGSPLQMLTEGATFSTAGAWQSVMGAVNAGIRGGSAALGEIVDRLGGRGEAAEKEAVNFGNWAMVESGFGRFSRPSVVGDHPVGTLPRAEDFTAPLPPSPGTVRFYHGADQGADVTSGGGRWVTPDPVYARDFRSDGTPKDVHYVDIPKGDPTEVVARAWDELDAGTSMEGRYNSIELPEHWAQQLRPHDDPVVERNLRDGWQDDGIHPSEALHDAKSDAFVKQDLETPPYHPPDRSGIAPPTNSLVDAGTPRTEIAKTGDPLLDAMLDHPTLRKVVNDPVIDDTHTIPNSWGGSVPLENPTVYIDKDFPRSLTIDGQTIDPADAAAVHENVEQLAMDILTKNGMDQATALKVAFWEFGEKAEDAFYTSHGMDPARVEETLKPIVDAIAARKADNVPPDLFRGTYPDGNPAKAGPGPIDKPTAAEIKQAREIISAHQERELTAAGADITRPENLPSLEKQPPSRPGSLVESARTAMDQLFGLSHNIQYLLDPMATGSKRAMTIAKDAMNAVRRVRWEHLQVDNEIVRRFDGEQQVRMWNAADEESVALQLGESREHQGLATLERDESNMVEFLHGDAQTAWLQVRDVGIVDGEGLPAYTPRMLLNVAAAGEHAGPRALNELGNNVFTRTAQMRHRKHMMAEETEAAAKELIRKRMGERGASPEEIEAEVAKVQIARNIRALPLATARLKEAAIWKGMINNIKDIGKAAGQELVADYQPDKSWFTIAGHPAFTEWKPAFAENPVTGKWEARVDDAGNAIFRPNQMYLPGEFKGPMRAIMDEPSDMLKAVPGAPSLYGALMAIKGKAMTAILNSPLIHNEVVWSKVAEAAGGREFLGVGLYFRGNRIVNGHPGRASELIERGLNPMGPRGAIQDIHGIIGFEFNPKSGQWMLPEPGRSWTAKIVAAVPGIFDKEAELATKTAIDKLGDFWHNTLLWDRVRDVHFGLADHLSDSLVAKGTDRLTADRIATHFSNIIVGSIPKEAMSAGARATANMALFSRSFTLGNLSTFKQAALGLPKPLLAQIERDFGMSADAALGPEAAAAVAQTAKSIARRKAISTIMLSAGLYYVGNALLQNGLNIAMRDSSLNEEFQGYAKRYADFAKDVSENPFELRHMIGRLSPAYDNEPGKQDRAHIGYDKDGTALYARNPTGKFGEEMVGYPTQPLTMFKRKMSPLAGGLIDVLENDKGFGGRKTPIYDENDTSIGGGAAAAFAVAKYLVMKHLPEGQINAAVDLLRGDGDPEVNKLRLTAPALGFTVSAGAPGGMARGEQFSAKNAFDARFNLAWPDIRKQIQRGDLEGAQNSMTGLGVPPGMQRGLMRSAMNPAGALRGRTLRDFFSYSTPQQQERLLNAPRAAP